VEKTNQIYVNQGRKIEWQDRDIISVIKDRDYPFNLDNASSEVVELMTPEIRERAMKIVQPKACYCNVAKMVLHYCRRHIRYVVGYASAQVPFDHAWIKVGDKYYDPTWELYGSQLGEEYLPLYEMSFGELVKTMSAMDTLEPPSALDLYYFMGQNENITQ
jgi:hypothetical protein